MTAIMRNSRGMVLAVCAVALVGASGCDAIMSLIRAQKAAYTWDGDADIAKENITKDGKVFTIELHARFDAPPEKVWEAMKQPERLSEFSEQYKKSELLKEDGNVKEIDFHVMALDNLQNFKMQLTFDDQNKKLTVKTLQTTLADIDGTYELVPSPDGTQTMYIYKAKQTDRVALPISVDVQRVAIKEAFVNQVKAIRSQLPNVS